MIQAQFVRQGTYLEAVRLTGHAQSGPYGYDIVCAAVSALSINFINSLEVLANCSVARELDEENGGYMQIDLSEVANKYDEKVQLLFESFLLGLSNLAENASDFVELDLKTNGTREEKR